MVVHHNVDRRGKYRSSQQRGDVKTRSTSLFTAKEDVRDIDEETGSSTFEDGVEVLSLAPAYSDAGTMPTVEEDGVLPRPERLPLPAFDLSEEDRRQMRSVSTPSRALRSSSEQRELAEEGGDKGNYPRTFDPMSAESGMRGEYHGGARGTLEDQPPVKGRTGRFASFVSNLDVSASGRGSIFSSFLWRANASNGGDDHTGPVSLGARGMLTEADEAMLSDSEADYDAFDSPSERADKRLFSPNFWVRRIYPIYMLLMLFVFVFYMPYRVAFHPRERGAFSMVDLMWNVVFFADILINLNTGFVNLDNGMVVYDRRAIFYRYLMGWFVVDALAAFPFTFLPGLGPEDSAGNHEIAHLLSAPKIFRLYGLLAFAQENYQWHEGGFLAVRTLLSVIITAHVFGCGWYMLSTLMHTECEDLFFGDVEEVVIDGVVFSSDDYVQAECPWTYRSGYVLNSIGRQYLSSVYWALTTLTTVGYGDISARTADEQVYSMAVQIVGVSWYGYIVGTWASVLNSFDSEEKEMRSKMREVVAFSKAAGLPHGIAKRVRQHFRFALYRKENWITFNEQEMLTDMPAALRAEVVLHVQSHTINQVSWLHGKDPSFIADMVMNLKPCLFRHGDEIFREGSPSEEIFFITTGKVVVKYKHSRVAILKAGNIVGLIGVFSGTTHKVSVIAAATGEEKHVKCFKLSRSDFFKLMNPYPKIMEDLFRRTKNLLDRISAVSPLAKADFVSNGFLADLTECPDLSVDDDPYGQGNDGRVQLSIGRQDDRDSIHSAAGRWPPGFEAMSRAAFAALRAKPSGNGQDEGEDEDEDEDEGEGEGEGESSNEELVSTNGNRRTVTDAASSGPPTTVNYDSAHALGSNHGSLTTVIGLEDAVSRELALRIPSIEATFISALERVMNERWKDGPPAIVSLAIEGPGDKVTAPNGGEREVREEKGGNVGD